uniref:Phospholipid-transporting ATPase n=1 Tax=Albugo laibachii Nc14 TaxID=890382 RepID=F0WRC5_9STRA|nr:phospholipidtransporting ATPase putative [Albugo laibachii Nc14]|eukprot:CCA23888.1 phospholipidtransporting ATPase putative [Albugo laibachii Nc14]
MHSLHDTRNHKTSESTQLERAQTVEVVPRQNDCHLSLPPNLDTIQTDFNTATCARELPRAFTSVDISLSNALYPRNSTALYPLNSIASDAQREQSECWSDQKSTNIQWQILTRFRLPRDFRFRQLTRTSTRYIDPSNAQPLSARLRARQQATLQEDMRIQNAVNHGEYVEIGTPVHAQKARAEAMETASTDWSDSQGRLDGVQGPASASSPSDYSVQWDGEGKHPSAGRDRYCKVVYLDKPTPLGHLKRIGDEQEDIDPDTMDFVSNEIRTAQYTWWSFLPVFLFLTFQKTANIYFLMIGIFQMIPGISPTSGVPLQFLPLGIVTFIDAIFAAYEDYHRHQADHRMNSFKTRVYNRQMRQFEAVEWREVKVGDYVKVKNLEVLPADLLIVSTDSGNSNGSNITSDSICYIETKNLDGETNLKLREAAAPIRFMFDNQHDTFEPIEGFLESELPNGDIHHYSGTLQTTSPHTGVSSVTPIHLKNVLYRGCRLRNTNCIYGLVIHTGTDCTILMNSGDEFPVKVSSIDEKTNRQVVIVVALVVLMSFLGALGANLYADYSKSVAFIVANVSNNDVVSTFFYFFTSLSSMVPITLYVSITGVRAMQAYFMEQDLEMYDEPTDTRMSVRKMTLNEQLGQISHLFSDKTGTLTCNIMEFRKCSINGKVYGTGTTSIGQAAMIRDDREICVEEPLDEDVRPAAEQARERYFGSFGRKVFSSQVSNVNFLDEKLWTDALDSQERMQGELIRGFLLHLALCHTVLIEQLDAEAEENASDQVRYSASSPDEQALVSMAKFCGYEFLHRDPGTVTIRIPDGSLETYKVLEVFEFDSTRKRMSVVVQKITEDTEEQILLLTKGADSALFPRLAKSAHNEQIQKSTQDHIEAFARAGLRTLVICGKRLGIDEWEAFQKRYQVALTDLTQLELKGKNNPLNEIDKLQDEMEQDLFLIGATAIEDRLQDQVPETMEKLGLAGIKLWVLTGDMEETAINIGYACRLLRNEMHRHIVNGVHFKSRGAVLRELDRTFHLIYSTVNTNAQDDQSTGEHALIIDGASLSLVLASSIWNLHLLRVALLCKVVIACRVSPHQKAQLVELVKVNVKDSHTLSIGDGANDVPMIQTAHIGVGISGQEGMQAVNSSDFAIPQFRFLLPLLLVHGRWNYQRISILTVYTFYRNTLYCLALFWYALWITGFSGQNFYSILIQQGYNVFFTALPILAFAIFDHDVPREIATEFPALYDPAIRQREMFTNKLFWKWMLYAFIDSILVVLVTFIAAYGMDASGNTVILIHLQSIGWTILCVAVNARFCLLVHTWDIFEVLAMIITIISVYLVQYIVDAISWTDPDYDTESFPWMFGDTQFWLGQLLVIVVICAKDFFYTGLCQRFYPAFVDLVKEATTAHKVYKGPLDRQDYEQQRRTELEGTLSKLRQFKSNEVHATSAWRTGMQHRLDRHLNEELISMMDYQERRDQSRLPERFHAPGREGLHRGFAFEQPVCLIHWILTTAFDSHRRRDTFDREEQDSGRERSSFFSRLTHRHTESMHSQRGIARKYRQGISEEVRDEILASEDPVIFENERFQLFSGFGSTYPGHLLVTDRCRWSDRSGRISAMAIPLAGLRLNLSAGGDSNGWVYAADFTFFPSNIETEAEGMENPTSEAQYPRQSEGRGSEKKICKLGLSRIGLVRRREWIRGEQAHTEAVEEMSPASKSPQFQSNSLS